MVWHRPLTTCSVHPAAELESCFSSLCGNPQLRVEARVFYLTEEGEGGLDFADFSNPADIQLPPAGGSVEYLGSTTGPQFSNEGCSPLQVTWNVKPICDALDRSSLDARCEQNVFGENRAHGVRRLVTPLELLSVIE